MATPCPACNGRGRIERQRERGGLIGKLRGPEIVSEKCARCNGTGAVQAIRQQAVPQSSAPTYFELRLPEGDGVCSDNYCPCGFPGARIPRGSGYVLISEAIVNWRRKFPTLAEWDRAQIIIQGMQADAADKEFMETLEVVPASGLQPIMCCQQSPLLEIVDRQVAAADAQAMWKSARLPLRATPLKDGNGLFSDKASLPARQAAVEGVALEQQQQHYVLKCRTCDFKLAIPMPFADNEMTFSVDCNKAELACVYGRFTVCLGVGEFFTVQSEPASGKTLKAEIAGNMKVLHPHMLSHCDPLFLFIRQTPTSTAHEFKRKHQEGADVPYVRYTRDHGIDFVGHEKVNVGKAEIPGVSWKL